MGVGEGQGEQGEEGGGGGVMRVEAALSTCGGSLGGGRWGVRMVPGQGWHLVLSLAFFLGVPTLRTVHPKALLARS